MFDPVTTLAYWTWASQQYTLSTVPQQVAGNEPNRVMLWFGNPGTVAAQLFIDPPPLPGGPGQLVVPAGENIRLNWSLDGVSTTLPYLAWVLSTTTTLSVTQFWWRPPRV